MSKFRAWVAAQQAKAAFQAHLVKTAADSSDPGGYGTNIVLRAAFYSTLTDVEAVYVGYTDVREPLYSFCIAVTEILRECKPAWFELRDWSIRVPNPSKWPPNGRALDGDDFLVVPSSTGRESYEAIDHVLVRALQLNQDGVVEA